MDICQIELTQTDDELSLTPPQSAASLLADCWVTLWTATQPERRQESERAAHTLCAALPLRTVEEARLN